MSTLEESDMPPIIDIETESDEEADEEESAMLDPFDPEKIRIQVVQTSLDNLITRLKNDEIDMNTDFQRHADLWDAGKMSRLIESILIRFPLPAFYFDATNDNRWLVVDGLQRLSAIRKFVPMKDGEKSDLALTGLEFLKDLKGKKYAELPRMYKRRIAEQQVTTYLIGPGTPADVKYSVFRRINTGGLTLNFQEIRHAMASPREREFLNRLARNEYLVKTMGDQSKRMLAQELVLRFVAFLEHDYSQSRKNIARFMDNALEHLAGLPEAKLTELEARFHAALRAAWEIFGVDAFQKRPSEQAPRQRKNSALFEVWTVSLARLAQSDERKVSQLIRARDDVQRRMLALTSEPEFFEAISMATQKKKNVAVRFEAVQQIIEDICRA